MNCPHKLDKKKSNSWGQFINTGGFLNAKCLAGRLFQYKLDPTLFPTKKDNLSLRKRYYIMKIEDRTVNMKGENI